MKGLLLLTFSCALVLRAEAQFLTETATGKGALLLPLNGVAVEFDAGKTQTGFNINNYSRALASRNSRLFHNWFFGGNITAGSSEGVGDLFKTGTLVPAASAYGMLGFSINNTNQILRDWKNSRATLLIKREQEEMGRAFRTFRDTVSASMLYALTALKDTQLIQAGQDLQVKIEASPDNLRLTAVLDSIYKINTARLVPLISAFKRMVEPVRTRYIAGFNRDIATKDIGPAFDEFLQTHRSLRFTPFLFGGIDARSFTLFNGINATTLSESFTDTLQRGGTFGAGFNAQAGTFWLGVTYTYISGDNFGNLTGKEYQLRTSNSSGSQTLTSDKKLTAYSGNYGKVKRNQLHIDLIKEFALGDTARLIADVYLRSSIFSRDTAYLKNTSGLGLGVYFLGGKSKFIGGLYVELPDINNNLEKSRPVAEQHLRSPFKRLSFGIVTKFSLSSIFGFVNKPTPG